MRVVGVLLLLLLAGCAGAPVQEAECEGDRCAVVVEMVPEPADKAAPPTPFDRVQGVVIDNIYAPISGAKVVLREGDDFIAEAKTGADGRFVFLKVLERPFQLDVTHPKYLDGRALVLPMARPQHILIPLERAIEQPRATLMQWDGMLHCSAYVAGRLAGDAACLGNDFAFGYRGDNTAFFHDELIVPGPLAVYGQAEVVWTPQTDQAQQLELDLYAHKPETSTNGRIAAKGAGTSPLLVGLTSETIAKFHVGEASFDGTGITTSLFAAGSGEGSLAGMAIDQPFSIYVSMAYGTPPPEGWMYVRDGPL